MGAMTGPLALLREPFDVSGLSVIVTGGTRGIGRGIAAVFADAGAQVLVTGRDREVGERAAAELSSTAAYRVVFVATDTAEPAAASLVAAAAIEAHGGIDVVCANAGIFPSASVASMTVEDFDRVYAVNVRGTMLIVQACLPALRASGRGRVVLTSSITGPATGYPGWSHYGASKAAQLGWMRSAALELAPDRITVNAVLPGNIATEGLEDVGAEYRAATEAAIPLHRLGTVAEIGYAALYLASDAAAFTTGQTITVDGGQTLPEMSLAIL